MTEPQENNQSSIRSKILTNKHSQLVAAHALWKLGDIRYKLKPCQSQMHLDVEKANTLKYIIKCSRRIGKSFYLVSRGTMRCLNQKGALVRYGAPTQKSLKTIIQPIMRKLTADCPTELMPRYSSSEGAYIFKDESLMYMSGVNAGHAENLRGNACDEFLIDEAGTIDDLDYLVTDIAMPQLLDVDGHVVSGRRLIISGTPPRTPAHEFTKISREAEIQGNFSHFTIYDGGYPDEIIDIFEKEAGGKDSSTWKREYLAQDVVDENYALIREWKQEYVQEPVFDAYYPFYHKYGSLDIGTRDKTVALSGHYDFKRAKLFVYGEVEMSGPDMTTEKLAEAQREKETELFKVKWEKYEENGKQRWKMIAPDQHFKIKRISDIDLLLISDLSKIHGLYFSPTDKGTLEEMVNEVRIWVNSGRIIVAPWCKQTVGCLAYGVWNKNRTDFDRVTEYGHFDALASLMYMIRNIDQLTNPVPATFEKPIDEYWHDEETNKSYNRDKLKKAFGQDRRRTWR